MGAFQECLDFSLLFPVQTKDGAESFARVFQQVFLSDEPTERIAGLEHIAVNTFFEQAPSHDSFQVIRRAGVAEKIPEDILCYPWRALGVSK